MLFYWTIRFTNDKCGRYLCIFLRYCDVGRVRIVDELFHYRRGGTRDGHPLFEAFPHVSCRGNTQPSVEHESGKKEPIIRKGMFLYWKCVCDCVTIPEKGLREDHH